MSKSLAHAQDMRMSIGVDVTIDSIFIFYYIDHHFLHGLDSLSK
jgi:hypothetical protein